MTTSLGLVITNAGLAAFTAAQLDQDIDLAIASVGFTDAQFLVAPTLDVLPGEFKRLDTISGQTTGPSTVHLTIRDESSDAYTVRGFGLFLPDGTLFAVYGQADAILEKASVSTNLLSLDLKFPPGQLAEVSFGDANFLYPAATEAMKGVAEIATQAETDSGTDDEKIVSPKKLKARLAGILQSIADLTATLDLKAWASRQITCRGLAIGGGDLTMDRQINVPAATAEEASAGALTNKAVTPSALSLILADIAARVPIARKIATAGLLTGGRTLAADLSLAVPKATAAVVRTGTDDASAVTPAALKDAGAIYVVEQQLGTNGYRIWSDGLKECWGMKTVVTEATTTIDLPVTHEAWVVPVGNAVIPGADEQNIGIVGTGLSSFTVYNGNPSSVPFRWHSKGY